MTAARSLLQRGQAVLEDQLGEPFLVDGFPGSFVGRCEETRHGNTLGMGGFIPDQSATLFVRLEQFAPLGLKPWPGMRVTVKDREFLVTEIGTNAQRWRLSLEIAYPKQMSDVPCFVSVLATHDRHPILYPGVGLIKPQK